MILIGSDTVPAAWWETPKKGEYPNGLYKLFGEKYIVKQLAPDTAKPEVGSLIVRPWDPKVEKPPNKPNDEVSTFIFTVPAV